MNCASLKDFSLAVWAYSSGKLLPGPTLTVGQALHDISLPSDKLSVYNGLPSALRYPDEKAQSDPSKIMYNLDKEESLATVSLKMHPSLAKGRSSRSSSSSSKSSGSSRSSSSGSRSPSAVKKSSVSGESDMDSRKGKNVVEVSE